MMYFDLKIRLMRVPIGFTKRKGQKKRNELRKKNRKKYVEGMEIQMLTCSIQYSMRTVTTLQ